MQLADNDYLIVNGASGMVLSDNNLSGGEAPPSFRACSTAKRGQQWHLDPGGAQRQLPDNQRV